MATPEIITKPPITNELAPQTENAAVIIDPFLKVMANPDRVLASKGGELTVYAEVLRDDQVKSTFQQRRLAVVSKPFDVESGGEDAASEAAAAALKDNIDKLDWDNITEQQLFSAFYGYGVGEVMWGVDQEQGLISIEEIKIRDRSRFRFGLDKTLYLIQRDFSFAPMPDRKFWVVSTGADNGDNPYGVGLAHWLYWPVYFKRMDIKFWLIFLEKFGQPTAAGKLPAGKADDKQTRTQLLQALRAIATETAVIIPEGAEVQLIEATRSGTGDYEAMKKAMDEAISKIVLSQTMTTDNGSSRSQSKTHKEVRDEVVAADSDLVCESFNRSVVKWWFEYNMAKWPGAKQPKVRRHVEPPEDLNERAKRDQAIKSLGFEPTEEYIKETYGAGWVKAAPVVPPAGAPQFGQPDPNAANFAESALVSALKAGNRGDQIALLGAAQAFANQHQDVLGARVQQLLDYADASNDYDTFRKHLTDMLAELPPTPTVDKIERGTFFSRLMGMFRNQRDAKPQPSAQDKAISSFAEEVKRNTDRIADFLSREPAPAPVVNVTMPPQQITVNIPKAGPVEQIVTRDDKGQIKTITTQERP